MSGNVEPPNTPRICILTPGHLSTNPRVVKEADALTGAGYEVNIIAADYALWRGKTIMRSRGDLGELFARCRSVRIRPA